MTNKPDQSRCIIYCVFAFVVFLFAVGQTIGQEPVPRPDAEPNAVWEPFDVPDDGEPVPGGGGFLNAPPSYLVLVKVSGSPLGGWVGSGSFITSRLVLTCHHNVRGLKDGRRVKVQSMDGTTYTKIKIVKTAPKWDLALLEVTDPVIAYHRTIDVQDTYAMTPVVASAGWNPEVPGMSLYQGSFNGRMFGGKTRSSAVYRGHTAKVIQGMSGGPLIDQELCLIGVNVAASEAIGGAMAVRCELIGAFLDSYDGPFEPSQKFNP